MRPSIFSRSAAADCYGAAAAGAARHRRPATFSVSTQLVVETVTVKDKNGKPVEGLTAKDFTVTEDGVPQTIRFFEYQKLRRDRRPRLPLPAPSAAPTCPNKTSAATQISPETPGRHPLSETAACWRCIST